MNIISNTLSEIDSDKHILPIESGKAIALTMNFPQHTSTSTSKLKLINNNENLNEQLKCNHITTDPHGCLDCMSTMFGPNYAPFAAFIREFSNFAQTQNTIAMKQNDIMETLLSYYRQQNLQNDKLDDQELQHAFTYGTWSNGKFLFSSNSLRFMTNRSYIVSFLICTTTLLLFIGINLVGLSIYLGTMKDMVDPVIAFIRGYTKIYDDEFLYFIILLSLIVIGAFYIITVIGYFSGLLGRSTFVTVIALIINLFGLLSSLIIIFIILFLSDRMKANFPHRLDSTMGYFESDTSSNSLSYSWTLMHRKYNCCFDGTFQTSLIVSQKAPTFASIHSGWLVPRSCCITDTIDCMQTPTINNSFVNSSCIQPASKHFNQLYSNVTYILALVVFVAIITLVCGIVYLMNLKTAVYRMNVNNDELVKSLFAIKSKYIAGIDTDITKDPIKTYEQIKTKGMKHKSHRINIPGYFPITPTILQVRKPEQLAYLQYE